MLMHMQQPQQHLLMMPVSQHTISKRLQPTLQRHLHSRSPHMMLQLLNQPTLHQQHMLKLVHFLVTFILKDLFSSTPYVRVVMSVILMYPILNMIILY